MKFDLKQARLHNHAEWLDIYEFPSKDPSAFIKVATHPEGAQILKHEHAVLQHLKLNYIPQILDFIDGANNGRVQLALKAIRGHSLHGVMGLEEFRKISEDCEVDESLTSRYVKARDNLKELMVEDRGFRQRQGTKINLE